MIDANPAAWLDLLALQPGAEVHDRWVVTDIPFPLCNSVFFPDWPDDEIDARIDEVLAAGAARGVPQLWWLGTTPAAAEVADRLDARGVVTDEEDLPGMHRRLQHGGLSPSLHRASPLRVARVRSGADLDAFAAVFGPGFGIGGAALSSVVAAFGAYAGDDVRHFVGREPGGRPVATATVILRDGVAGLYDVATVADARGRGYGAAITVAALEDAAAAGARDAILHASPSGFGIYRRLAFEVVAASRTVETSAA